MRADPDIAQAPPVRVTIITLDAHAAGPAQRAEARLRRAIPGLRLTVHAAAAWAETPAALEAAKRDVARAHIVVANMLFLEEHVRAILPALQARRPHCDAMIGMIAGAEVAKLTRLGSLDMSAPQSGVLRLLKRLRGKGGGKGASGAGQMKMLRRLPRILRFIPGKAQDLRAYFLSMQYWLAGSDENVEALVRFLVSRYAAGPRAAHAAELHAPAPVEHPEVGVYHPRLPGRIAAHGDSLPRPAGAKGTVGLLLMRAYVLAGDTAHYDAVIAALEARGLAVRPVFAAGLDARPAIEAHLSGPNRPDALLSLTGFSLVGGPAYNDAGAAEAALAELDVPYVAAHALEFQSLEQWAQSPRGLGPVEATMLVALPEIDGATGPMVFGGRGEGAGDPHAGGPRAMRPAPERVERLADRMARLVALRRSRPAGRRVAIVLYGFPPNAGAVGSAAHLAVFESLFNLLQAMRTEGYDVHPPGTVEDLRRVILEGDGGQPAAIAARIPADRLVAEDPWIAETEAQWGPAPGRHQSDGGAVFVLGREFGDVFVGVQPAFGWEGDPMRLLFEGGFAPTHAFSAFYRWIRQDFGADAVLHFGMHGALEFMPGKQTGLGPDCWPDRLIGDLPNIYLYAANNPSEAALAKRRAAATLVTHLTPPLARAGLYKGLTELKATLERWRRADPTDPDRPALAELLQAQAAELDLAPAEPAWRDREAEADALRRRLLEYEDALIPHGLHVLGRPLSDDQRADHLAAMREAQGTDADLSAAESHLRADAEIPAILRALSGRFIRPAPGGDVARSPGVLPTGRNMHGFDPFRMPSPFALAEGRRQADLLLARHRQASGALPRAVALVLWGCDNIKSEGAPLAQALALLGARPRFDSYGRLCGAELIPLDQLGRPRIDVLMTLSGIFRDLLPLQSRCLAEAARLAALAEEPEGMNPVRAHALAHAEATGCTLETAALRVFSNAEGAYGSNVNHLIESGAWEDEDELAGAFEARKGFAYAPDGACAAQPELLSSILGRVDLAYQNLESVELGVTSIDHYFDTLGGVGRAVRRARGEDAPIYISDHTRGDGQVRTLSEQVSLETRTRALNPKYHEGLLAHGHEGVRQIEAHVSNTLGWSATSGQVEPWVYQRLTETFVLDEAMRRRLADLNPTAAARLAGRLIEAHERRYWTPDADTLAALTAGADELEDRLEGVEPAAVAAE